MLVIWLQDGLLVSIDPSGLCADWLMVCQLYRFLFIWNWNWYLAIFPGLIYFSTIGSLSSTRVIVLQTSFSNRNHNTGMVEGATT